VPLAAVGRFGLSEEFWSSQWTVSTVDFIPSDPCDSVEDLHRRLNEWLVGLPGGQQRVVSIKTTERDWEPDGAQAHGGPKTGGLLCAALYRVVCLRLSYRSEGASSHEEVFTRGDGSVRAPPINFPPLQKLQQQLHLHGNSWWSCFSCSHLFTAALLLNLGAFLYMWAAGELGKLRGSVTP